MNKLIFLVYSNVGEQNFHEVITTKLVIALAVIFLLLFVSDLSRKSDSVEKQD